MNYKKYMEIHTLCVDLKRNIFSLQGSEKIIAENTLKSSVDLLESLCGENVKDVQPRPKRKKKEIVFFPYKADMWDSLESIWMAANADPDCVTKVIPIPYYTVDSKKKMSVFNYEVDRFPKYVPITPYDQYDIAVHHPDVVYIHYPYSANNITALRRKYYAENIKPHTDMLVYVPYYTTTGGMSEDQRYLLSYHCVDYIITQAQFINSYFDETLPDDRLQALGSPKFDRVINMCNNPPKPPDDWQLKLNNRTTYFYNTSIGGMLQNTNKFFQKMCYVFQTFEKYKDRACIIWRPHPLLESSLKSMRPAYLDMYYKLIDYFKDNDIGIFDDTSDITKTIALSDYYIGDSGTSVTSLFGIAGKPMFIFNNNFYQQPQYDSWKSAFLFNMNYTGYFLYSGSQLFSLAGGESKYLGQVGKYTDGWEYSGIFKIGQYVYICPIMSLAILKIKNSKIVERINLNKFSDDMKCFRGAVICDNYLCLLPNTYPAIVIYDTVTGEVKYVKENVELLSQDASGKKCFGGARAHKGKLYIGTPVESQIIEIDPISGVSKIIKLPVRYFQGCLAMNSDGDDLWLLPMFGESVVRINFEKNLVWEYRAPECVISKDPFYSDTGKERLFSSIVFHGDKAYCAPYWSSDFVVINKVTEKVEVWNTPIMPSLTPNDTSVYYSTGGANAFWGYYPLENKNNKRRLYSGYNAKWYDVDLSNKTFSECAELNNSLQRDEALKAIKGFGKTSTHLRYSCGENAFNSLEALLSGNLQGDKFNKAVQKAAYNDLAANNDGTCGKKVHMFIMSKLGERLRLKMR